MAVFRIFKSVSYFALLTPLVLFSSITRGAGNEGCAVHSPGTALSCPTQVSLDQREAGGNLVISGFGSNKIHVVCRSGRTGLCSHITGDRITAENGDPAGELNAMYTLAGNGWPVNSGDGSRATEAGIFQPSATAVDSHGNVLVAAHSFHTVRVVCMNAGGVCSGMTDGTRLYARGQNGGTEPIQPGHIYHLAGVWSRASTNPNYGFGAGAGCQGVGDAVPANESCLNEPYGIAVDSHDNVIIADTHNSRLRIVCLNDLASDPYCSNVSEGTVVASGGIAEPGRIYTLAGAGNELGDGGEASQAQLSTPISVAVDLYDNVAVSDGAHFRVRMICAGNSGLCRSSQPRFIFTIAGPNGIGSVGGVGFDAAGNLLISDPGHAAVNLVCTDSRSGVCARVAAREEYLYRLPRPRAEAGYISTSGFSVGSAGGAWLYPMHAQGYPANGSDELIVTDRDRNLIRFFFY